MFSKTRFHQICGRARCSFLCNQFDVLGRACLQCYPNLRGNGLSDSRFSLSLGRYIPTNIYTCLKIDVISVKPIENRTIWKRLAANLSYLRMKAGRV
jgi:hypothetical protein